MAWSNKLQTALFHDSLRAPYTEMADTVYMLPSLIFRMGGQISPPHLILGCSLSQSTPLPPQLLLSLVACLLLNPALSLTSCLWTWVEASSPSSPPARWHSPQQRMQKMLGAVGEMTRHTTGAHLELCHCPPEQTQREWEAGKKPVGKPSTNWRRSAGEWQPMYNNISLPLRPKRAAL